MIAGKLRRGDLIKVSKKPMEVIQTKTTSGTGRGLGYVQLECKDYLNHKNRVGVRLRSNEAVELVDVYHETIVIEKVEAGQQGKKKEWKVQGEGITNEVSYQLDERLFGDYGKYYLKEGMEFSGLVVEDDDEVLTLRGNESIPIRVTHIHDNISSKKKGTKPAKVSNQRTVNVPNHVEEGDWVLVNVSDESYIKVLSEEELEDYEYLEEEE